MFGSLRSWAIHGPKDNVRLLRSRVDCPGCGRFRDEYFKVCFADISSKAMVWGWKTPICPRYTICPARAKVLFDRAKSSPLEEISRLSVLMVSATSGRITKRLLFHMFTHISDYAVAQLCKQMYSNEICQQIYAKKQELWEAMEEHPCSGRARSRMLDREKAMPGLVATMMGGSRLPH